MGKGTPSPSSYPLRAPNFELALTPLRFRASTRGFSNCVVYADELTTKYEELSRVRDELGDQLVTARRDEQIARANVKATEQANCMPFSLYTVATYIITCTYLIVNISCVLLSILKLFFCS